jgi:CBS domain containing-hemolysin-like protein
MTADIFGLMLILISLVSLGLQRFYSCVPAKELKRLAARGERVAVTLYRPVAYGASLRALLWIIAVGCLSGGFLLLAQNLPAAISIVIMVVVLTLASVWIPSRQLTVGGARIAAWAAPTLEWVLHRTNEPLTRLAEFINAHRQLEPHSGLYEKDDLRDLLAQQEAQQDNRIDVTELALMQSALHFANTKAAEIAVPRKDAPMLSTSDALGPILFDELHKTGQQFFIVYRGKPDNVVGMLALKDAKHARKGGTVADAMTEELCFVGEDFTLPQLAKAFIATGQQVAIVINRFEEFVGMISFSSLMNFLFAAQMKDQPDIQYDDQAAVANFRPQTKERRAEEMLEPEPAAETTTSPEISEVVE